MVFLFVLICFELILDGLIFLRGFGNIQKSKMADQDGRYTSIMTNFLSHVTPSLHDADLKGDIFRRTIYPLSLVVITFIFKELWMEGGEEIPPPPPSRPKKKPGLNRVQGTGSDQNFMTPPEGTY